MKTRKKARHGGEVFQGSEGCVFVPELKSKGSLFSKTKYPTRSGKFITKVYVSPTDLANELKGIGLMKQIDPNQQYTSTFVDISSKPDMSSIATSESCTLPLPENPPALYMYYNGVSILTLKKQGRLNPVLRQVLKGLSRLSELFTKMSRAGIIHGDIHAGNLLYNQKDTNVYLIDFTAMDKPAGLTDRSIDIKSLWDVIFAILNNYKKSVGEQSNCGMVLNQILTDIAPKIKSTKDVEVIQTFITTSIDSVLAKCFVGGKKTLRKKVHRNMH
jgi:hypothetical protein